MKITLMKEMRHMSYGWIYTTGLDAQLSCKNLEKLLEKKNTSTNIISAFVTNSHVFKMSHACVVRIKKTALAKPMSRVNLLHLLLKRSNCCLAPNSKYLISPITSGCYHTLVQFISTFVATALTAPDLAPFPPNAHTCYRSCT